MFIDLHGYVIECIAPTPELQAELVRPFSQFLSDADAAAITIEVIESTPPYAEFPELEASFSTPRNVIYDTRDYKLVDYFGKGATVEDKRENRFTIYGDDHNFLQEAFYLLVLSIFGQYCDRNGMLRIHAMSLSYADRAILVPLPPGGGKSTMAVSMLQEEGFRLISDDEPVVSTSGGILPFALRIGTLDEERVADIPPEYVYRIDRMEFGPKYFIDIQYWEEKLEHRELRDVVYLVARRVLNGTPAIYKTPKYKAAKSLLRDAVIGVGLYQGLEFMLGHSAWATLAQVGTVFRRSIVAWKVLRHAETYSFTITTDIAENRRVLSEFARGLHTQTESNRD